MKKKILWLGLSFLLVAALVFASCGPAAPEEEVLEKPDPNVRWPRLFFEYKYLQGGLVGGVVNVIVENKGGAGPVEVIFEVENEEVTRELVHGPRLIVYLEAGEEREVSTFLRLSESELRELARKYQWKGWAGSATREIEIPVEVTASPARVDIDSLIRDLDHQDLEVRKNAAVTLGEVREKRAVEPLITALKDDETTMRAVTAEALGKIKDERAVEPLITALKDNDFNVRAAAAESLGELKDKRAVELLIKILETGKSVESSASGGAAWIFGHKAPVSERLAAAESLGKIGDPRAVEPLIKALEYDQPWTREAAANSLGELKDERAIEPLITALEDDDSYVRAAANAALEKIRNE